MLSRSGKQKIQSLTIKTRLSQLPGGRIRVYLYLTVGAAFGVYYRVAYYCLAVHRTAAYLVF